MNEVIEVKNNDTILGMIERMAINPDFDVAKMQALLDIRNQELVRLDEQHQLELTRKAKQEFAADYVLMSAKLPLIAKSKRNEHTKSKYAALEDINQEIRPILGSHGFSITADITEQTKESISVEVTLLHKGGHEKSLKLTLPIDSKGSGGNANKTEIQGIASSITYAKRVAICALLNISTGDDVDGNAVREDKIATFQQREAIAALYRQLPADKQEDFTSKFGGIAEIKMKDVNIVIAALNKVINQLKGTK